MFLGHRPTFPMLVELVPSSSPGRERARAGEPPPGLAGLLQQNCSASTTVSAGSATASRASSPRAGRRQTCRSVHFECGVKKHTRSTQGIHLMVLHGRMWGLGQTPASAASPSPAIRSGSTMNRQESRCGCTHAESCERPGLWCLAPAHDGSGCCDAQSGHSAPCCKMQEQQHTASGFACSSPCSVRTQRRFVMDIPATRADGGSAINAASSAGGRCGFSTDGLPL